MTSTLIVNARLVNEGREFDGDLRFADGLITEIGNGLAAREGETVIDAAGRYWREYALCEDLADLETQFQLWRFRHMRTVQRIIGFKPGTGGSSGVAFLRKALELSFFPELFEVRTAIGPGRDYGAPAGP